MKPNRIYTIGKIVSEGGGHGDPGGRAIGVVPMDWYLSGNYPVAFYCKAEAESYYDYLLKHGWEIVELSVLTY